MLITGAEKPEEMSSLLLKLAAKALLGVSVDGVSVHSIKLGKKKLENKLYLKEIKTRIGNHYKNNQ